MLIPIIVIKKILDSLITFIRVDYNSALASGVVEESFLYRVLYGNSIDGFDFYTQGVDIFTRTPGSARKIVTKMGFDIGSTELPTIYVHHSIEPTKGVNTIGFGMDENEFYQNSDGSHTDKFFRGFGSTFEYVCVSPNINEAILMYEVIHAALISSVDTFNDKFNTFNFTGREAIARNDSMPNPLFLKVIQLDVDYIKEVPRLITRQLVNNVEFNNAIVYTETAVGSNLI
jgi:hypothetical protein